MKSANLWAQASDLHIQTGGNIAGNFSIGFDSKIPEETKDALIKFVYWVEDHYHLPVTLWVDFKYRHYLLDRKRRRVGYLFYWADFLNYPIFDDPDDIPVIELPVRTEHSSIDEILTSFIEATTHYFAWLSNCLTPDFQADTGLVDTILQEYKRT